jgi:hypothetical protein
LAFVFTHFLFYIRPFAAKSENAMQRILLSSVVTLLLGCSKYDKPFNGEEWNRRGVDWWTTDVRERMIKDIIESDTLIGLRKEEVIALLGKPEKTQGNTLYIFVREKYTRDIDPDYITYLIIDLDDHEKVRGVREYKTK